MHQQISFVEEDLSLAHVKALATKASLIEKRNAPENQRFMKHCVVGFVLLSLLIP